MVLRETLSLLALGAALGTPAAMGLRRFIASLLYEITPADPLSLAVALFVLVSTTVLAGWLPARRAARTEPATALRYE